MRAGITRRKFMSKLINGLLLFCFFERKKATAESNDKLIAQAKTECFLVVYPANGIFHPRDIKAGSKICGSQKGLQYLQDNFDLQPNISFLPISLAEMYTAMQHGVCQAGILLGSGSYTAIDLEQRLFRHSGLKVIEVWP